MDGDEVEVHKNVKRERGQYPAILTELPWSIKDLLYGIKSTEKNDLRTSFDWLHFKFKFQIQNKLLCLICRVLLQNVFLKVINIFVSFVFILVDAFSGSIRTEKSQKIFLP